MGRLILGLVASFIVIMLVLALAHAILFYAFFLALIAVVVFAVFSVGRWSGRRRRRRI